MGGASCNSGASSDPAAGPAPASIGTRVSYPGGGSSYFVDDHRGGTRSRLGLVEVSWGRLVDVYGLLPGGGVAPEASFRDFVIGENAASGTADFVLETNPITQKVRLIVQRVDGAPEPSPGAGTFTDLVRRASETLPVVLPKPDDGSGFEPFSFVARNATLVLRFDDLLADDALASSALPETVRIAAAYPPTVPFAARLRFDAHHGGERGGAFHSSRILVDTTVSAVEAASHTVPLGLNSLGLPASLPNNGQPNVSIRIPTREDPSSGQFRILRSIGGAQLSTTANGPVDSSSPTVDVVRAMRAGNGGDVNNGFLVDLDPPELIGGWPIEIEAAYDQLGGQHGFDYVVDLRFNGTCRGRPEVGDILGPGVAGGGVYVEVLERAGRPDSQGRVPAVRVRNLAEDPLDTPSVLLGAGLFETSYSPSASASPGCWVSFVPAPGAPPADGVSPETELVVRFSEPMDPDSILPFETLVVGQGPAGAPPSATGTVVAGVQASTDLRYFTYRPAAPLRHLNGIAERYHLILDGGPDGIRDLGGNAPLTVPAPIEFGLDPGAPEHRTGGIVLRFDSVNEYTANDPDPGGNDDLRGQFFYDFAAGRIVPRAPMRFSVSAHGESSPVTGLMAPFGLGVQTPLSPLGSKLQSLWRYCDFGWLVEDETKVNLDVEGLSWSPVGGLVLSDYYPEFQMRLSHSAWIPDEFIDPLSRTPTKPQSGLVDKPRLYAENVLIDPLSPQKIVHPKALGYRFSSADLYVNQAGVPLIPFPMNTPGLPYQSFTWRDTSVLALGGRDSAGVPLQIEVEPPLMLYGATGVVGSYAGPDKVPASALPLLFEIRCYPTSTGIGLNAFDVSFAINTSAAPNFRAFSTGGVNTAGTTIIRDPDLERFPRGGFNPRSVPPGKTTFRTGDNTFYHGQLDLVIRVSRVHTVWIEAGSNPDYRAPILNPPAIRQPTGTQVLVDFRGATFFNNTQGAEFDGRRLNAYGDPDQGTVQYHLGRADWSSDIDAVDGARFVQLRMSFLNDVNNGLSPFLSALGMAWTER